MSTEELHLVKDVSAIIGPLLTGKGFKLCKASPSLVEYISDLVRIVIRHDAISFEIDVEFCLIEPREVRVSLNDLLAYRRQDKIGYPGFFQASGRDRMTECLNKIGLAIREYGEGILEGSCHDFQMIVEFAHARNAAYTAKFSDDRVRRSAEQAWASHDYETVWSCYSSIRDKLTEIEVRRLSYAASKCEKM